MAQHDAAVRVKGRTAGGLRGHVPGFEVARAAAAEALGAFILVLAIVSAAVGATLLKPIAGLPYGSLAVPLAGGVALTVVVAGLGGISGAHVNPAVTVGLAANRRFPWAQVPVYVVAQFAGAIAAAAVTWAMYGGAARSQASLGASLPAAGVSVWRVLVAEAIVTFLLVFVIGCVTTDPKISRAGAAVAIGAALAIGILIAGPISGGAVNPARAIGPMIVAGVFTDWWAYLVAPLVAGVLAITTSRAIVGRPT